MSFFERLKRWRDLAKLRRRARRTPSPGAFAELAERLVALGEIEAGLRAAEEGLELFPDSERLAYVRTFSKKRRMTGRIRKLKDDLQRRPNPIAYGQLAEIYRELGSHDEALEAASECAERFPLNESPHLLQGEIRLERFMHDLIARDAMISLTAFEKVVRINAQNARAHLMLGQLRWLVGDCDGSLNHLREVLALDASRRDVEEFVREMVAKGHAGPSAFSFEELAEKVETQRAFANDATRFPSPEGKSAAAAAKHKVPFDAARVASDVERLGEQPGVFNAMVLDREDRCVADFTGVSGVPSGQFVELVTTIRDTADEASRRMDTGALVRAEIEGPGKNVTVARAGGYTVAVLYEDPLRADRVWEILQDFVSRNLTGVREAARA